MEDIVGIKETENLIIAYEPDDFIGGSKITTKENIIDFIKGVRELTDNKSKIVYGGGINTNNINILKEIDELDGIVVGSNSINREKFEEIIKNY